MGSSLQKKVRKSQSALYGSTACLSFCNSNKYNWDEVHAEAEGLEHVCSDKFINKLEEYLGHPKFDPHGEPIPDKHGKMPATHYKLLNAALKVLTML
jgi:Mn-dependent DtxR family transcriptional regulator